MKIQTRKTVTMLSAVLTALLVLAQFFIVTIGSGGARCSSSLSPVEGPQAPSWPAFDYFDYGFPFSYLSVTISNCIEMPTTYEWSTIGLGLDGFLLILIAYPLWSHFLGKRPANPIPAPSSLNQ